MTYLTITKISYVQNIVKNENAARGCAIFPDWFAVTKSRLSKAGLEYAKHKLNIHCCEASFKKSSSTFRNVSKICRFSSLSKLLISPEKNPIKLNHKFVIEKISNSNF